MPDYELVIAGALFVVTGALRRVLELMRGDDEDRDAVVTTLEEFEFLWTRRRSK